MLWAWPSINLRLINTEVKQTNFVNFVYWLIVPDMTNQTAAFNDKEFWIRIYTKNTNELCEQYISLDYELPGKYIFPIIPWTRPRHVGSSARVMSQALFKKHKGQKKIKG